MSENTVRTPGQHGLHYYNQQQIWDGYAKNTQEVTRAKETVKCIPDDVRTVLDIGCGNGLLTNMVNRNLVVGMDFAATPLKSLLTHAVCGSVVTLPFKPRAFDLVLITEVLEHLPEPSYFQALREIGLLDAKYLLISVPYDEDLDTNVCKCATCGNLFHPSLHCRTFRDDWYIDAFPGYSPLKTRYMTPVSPRGPVVARLKQELGVYTDNRLASCPVCGGRAERSNRMLMYLYYGIRAMEIAANRVLRVRKPYHQIVLLEQRKYHQSPSSQDTLMMEKPPYSF